KSFVDFNNKAALALASPWLVMAAAIGKALGKVVESVRQTKADMAREANVELPEPVPEEERGRLGPQRERWQIAKDLEARLARMRAGGAVPDMEKPLEELIKDNADRPQIDALRAAIEAKRKQIGDDVDALGDQLGDFGGRLQEFLDKKWAALKGRNKELDKP